MTGVRLVAIFVALGVALPPSAFASETNPSGAEATLMILQGIQKGLKDAKKKKKPSDPTTKKRTEVVVRRGEERRLAGSTSYDETLVGSCFNDDLEPIAARLDSAVKGRDVDEQALRFIAMTSEDSLRLNLKFLDYFEVSPEQVRSSQFFAVSQQVTTKKWIVDTAGVAERAPKEAAWCVTEATEGRTVDVLFTASQSKTGGSATVPPLVDGIDANLSGYAAANNMRYEAKFRGYKSKDGTPPDYTSIRTVLTSVTDGAAFIMEAKLVAVRDQTREVFERTATTKNHFVIDDGYMQPFSIASKGEVQIEVTADQGVSVDFTNGSGCKPTGESTRHSISCRLTKPTVMNITNPSLLGLGNPADVNVSVKTTTTRKK